MHAWGRVACGMAFAALAMGLCAGRASAVETDDKAAQQAKTAAQLKNSEWTLEMAPLGSGAAAPRTPDVLRFENGHVMSDKFGSEGFQATGFSVTVSDDGTAIWETMQTKSDGQTLSWRGELQDDTTMKGIISQRSVDGQPTDLWFIGRRATAPLPAATPLPEAVVLPEAPADTSTAETRAEVSVTSGDAVPTPESVAPAATEPPAVAPAKPVEPVPVKPAKKKGWW